MLGQGPKDSRTIAQTSHLRNAPSMRGQNKKPSHMTCTGPGMTEVLGFLQLACLTIALLEKPRQGPA